jgi:tRNA 2-thiocytidine biosynthesis protein TtcA
VRLIKAEGCNRINEGLTLIRRIKERYAFLEKHARVLIGISGGVDSAVLLALLHEYNERYAQGWSLHACHVSMNMRYAPAGSVSWCESYNVPYTIIKGQFPGTASERLSTCYRCARQRRQKLLEVAESMNIQQIALAHHKQDVAETFLLNTMYNGEISTLLPKQSVIQGRHFFIRPLYGFEKKMINTIASIYGFKISRTACPYFKNSKRNNVRTFLEQCHRQNPDVYKNIFRALSHVKRAYLP